VKHKAGICLSMHNTVASCVTDDCPFTALRGGEMGPAKYFGPWAPQSLNPAPSITIQPKVSKQWRQPWLKATTVHIGFLNAGFFSVRRHVARLS